jgi:hypothetical protein
MLHSTTLSCNSPVACADFIPQLIQRIPQDQIEKAVHASRINGTPRQRRYPRSFLLWVTIAGALYSDKCWTQVARKLLPLEADFDLLSSSALAQARNRLGYAPFLQLNQQIVRPLASLKKTPRAFYRGFHLKALDSTTVSMPDTPANVQAFGYSTNQHGHSHYPLLRITALVEVGTHAFLHWSVKPNRTSEIPTGKGLMKHLKLNDLLLHDCAFFGGDIWELAICQGAEILGRVQKGPLLLLEKRLSDGSYLTTIYATQTDRRKQVKGRTVRVIKYRHNDPRRTRCGEVTRLVTTLLDEQKYPAEELIDLYHLRWEEELAFDELKTHLNGREVTFRSKTPLGVLQEVSGLMLAHYVIRATMVEAGELSGVDPLTISFMETLDILQSHLREAPPLEDVPGCERWWQAILRRISKQILPERRNRIYPRVIKKGRNKFPTKKSQDRGANTQHFDFFVEILI